MTLGGCFGKSIPMAALLQECYGLFVKVLKLSPAIVEAGQDLFDRQVYSAASSVGSFHRLPLCILESLGCRVFVGGVTGKDFRTDRLVSFFERAVFGLEFCQSLGARRGILLLGCGFLGMIALVELLLALLIFLLRGSVASGKTGMYFGLDRRTLGHKTAKVGQ